MTRVCSSRQRSAATALLCPTDTETDAPAVYPRVHGRSNGPGLGMHDVPLQSNPAGTRQCPGFRQQRSLPRPQYFRNPRLHVF